MLSSLYKRGHILCLTSSQLLLPSVYLTGQDVKYETPLLAICTSVFVMVINSRLEGYGSRFVICSLVHNAESGATEAYCNRAVRLSVTSISRLLASQSCYHSVLPPSLCTLWTSSRFFHY